ncbi:leucine--tRNA ligase [Haladaptatus sp. AB643]|uniref:leucine--tRNA ligase n=1 Tax=Haladaptatus sp. AB643 TaxID=2934174 RepID=UPI00209BF0B8|nr:leucine--tRNA ligase [Haladaptatus sp. AB643]MCO8242569.1 leucine--tRNA ligase [Haladaptatus sp. AB643]
MKTRRQFDHTEIEHRWQEAWDDADVFHIPDEASDPAYVLGMFPYTSGQLHMGHVRNYTITDAYARYKRMDGENVLHPMGWDSFGLPAENAAIERDTNPRDWTLSCIDTMREQMADMGFGYDWEREITTCQPDYYRWNQWLFTQFREEGLVEREAAEINWCPSCETVLADEQVEGDAELCWRCDTPVEQRELDQWFLKITEYADELLDDLDELDGWPSNVRQMQRNWIGRQHGSTVEFDVEGYGPVEVFTTRLDTIFGVSFFALAPGHPIAEELAEEDEDIAHFVDEVADPEGDEPQGIATDLTATNPATGEEIPVFVADFVLTDVGTGALMGVPGHDSRDHAFAMSMDVDITPVVAPSEDNVPDVSEAAYTEDGVLVNSDDYDGLDSDDARERLEADIESAAHDVQYRLRDWGISRQRYWGTPIPIIHCEECGPVSVPDEELPVELPEFVQTTGNPLDAAEEWNHVECPECGGDARRETDTMDTFMDSSWYFLRYVSPHLDDAPFDTEQANDWMPVDRYVGGIEHAVMHLLYSRFVTKVLSDMELLSHREPFTNLVTQGMVLLDGDKMSKSKGNVVSPQRIVEEYGADTARLFTMQAAQPEKDFDWTEEGVKSSHQFLERLAGAVESFVESSLDGEHDEVAEYVEREIDATVAIANDEFESLTFNGALRETQELTTLLTRYREETSPHGPTLERGLRTVVKLLAPVTPHICEELWGDLGGEGFVVEAEWPEPEMDPTELELARQLVENTQEDVRHIVTIADIDDPERIDIVVAAPWQFEALDIARESDAPNVIGEIMQEDEIRKQGDDAAKYGQELQQERQSLPETLSPEREQVALRRANWLFEREFDADVHLLTADEADGDLAAKARPGRPAIHID